jgi:hypothetical protein
LNPESSRNSENIIPGSQKGNTSSHSIVKNSLVDMKSKLQDIQNNKMYLEKKIYEYEKKLTELKGG